MEDHLKLLIKMSLDRTLSNKQFAPLQLRWGEGVGNTKLGTHGRMERYFYSYYVKYRLGIFLKLFFTEKAFLKTFFSCFLSKRGSPKNQVFFLIEVLLFESYALFKRTIL